MKSTVLLSALLTLPITAQMQPAVFTAPNPATLGPITGKLKNSRVVSVVACAGALAATQAGGDIYAQAFKQGYITLDPATITALLTHSSSTNWRALLAWGLPIISGGVTAAGTSELINIAPRNQPKWNTAGVVLTGMLAAVSTQIKGSAPDPTPLLSLLIDPAKTYQVSAASCLSGLIGAQK